MRGETLIARHERRKKYAGERLVKYLTNAGAWYYARYAPSVAKLKDWLTRRSQGDLAALQNAWRQLEPLFCERAVLDSRVRALLGRGKSKRFTHASLLRAQFTPAEIEKVFQEYAGDFSSWENYRPRAEKKLRSFLSRGKTEKECQAALRAAFPDFRKDTQALVREVFSDFQDGDVYAAALAKALAKHGKQTREGRGKVFQKLVSRGYAPERVRKSLGEPDEH